MVQRVRVSHAINNINVIIKIVRITFLFEYSTRNWISRPESVENHFRGEQITETDVTQRSSASMRAISPRLCTGDTSCDDFLHRRHPAIPRNISDRMIKLDGMSTASVKLEKYFDWNAEA